MAKDKPNKPDPEAPQASETHFREAAEAPGGSSVSRESSTKLRTPQHHLSKADTTTAAPAARLQEPIAASAATISAMNNRTATGKRKSGTNQGQSLSSSQGLASAQTTANYHSSTNHIHGSNRQSSLTSAVSNPLSRPPAAPNGEGNDQVTQERSYSHQPLNTTASAQAVATAISRQRQHNLAHAAHLQPVSHHHQQQQHRQAPSPAMYRSIAASMGGNRASIPAQQQHYQHPQANLGLAHSASAHHYQQLQHRHPGLAQSPPGYVPSPHHSHSYSLHTQQQQYAAALARSNMHDTTSRAPVNSAAGGSRGSNNIGSAPHSQFTHHGIHDHPNKQQQAAIIRAAKAAAAAARNRPGTGMAAKPTQGTGAAAAARKTATTGIATSVSPPPSRSTPTKPTATNQSTASTAAAASPAAADLGGRDQQQLPEEGQPEGAEPVATDARTIQEDQIAKQRSVLVEQYAPFIAPSDRSLADARQRLKTALEQVRELRCAFTERVYGKYRVCLKQPNNLEETMESIKADPVACSRRIEKEIQQIKEEKDLEKKESQALNAEFSKMDPSTLSVSADNAEQLMYTSAGLSLVILPEDVDVDPKHLQGYQERAPTNPSTGQRVRGISHAAAAAGEIILERARKGAAMRAQWLQQGKLPHHDTEALSSSSNISAADTDQPQTPKTPMEILTAPSATPIINTTAVASSTNVEESNIVSSATEPEGATEVAIDAAPELASTQAATAPVADQNPQTPTALKPPPSGQDQPQLPLLQPAEAASTPVSKVQIQEPRSLKRHAKASAAIAAAQASSAKFGKSRGGAGISVNISLSLNPTADELGINLEQSCRASTAALMARGVGTAQGINRASPQQRLRHPHPESSGGRQRASSATSAKKELATLASVANNIKQQTPYVHSYRNLALPPLPTPMERRDRKPLVVVDQDRSSSYRAKKAIRSVLMHLQEKSDTTPPASKIDLLHSIHQSRNAPPAVGANESPDNESKRQRPIDPTLAFSVLQAIGLITDVGRNDSSCVSPTEMDEKIVKLKTGEKRKLFSLPPLSEGWERIRLSKRPRYSDALLGKSSREDSEVARLAKAAKTAANRATASSPVVVNIRGGGELLSETSDETTSTGAAQGLPDSNSRKSDARAGNSTYGNNVENRLASNNIARDTRQPPSRWEDPSRQSLGIINSHLGTNSTTVGGGHSQSSAAAPVAPRHQGQQVAPNGEYHHPSSFNALHLAHQFRHANGVAGLASHGNHPPADMQVGNYMGGLHAGHWSSIGSSAAAMAAAQSQLAALGLSVPMGVYNAVHDRAARALIAREQQNVAAAHAVAAHQQSMQRSGFLGGAANPGFAASSLQQQQHAGNRTYLHSSAQQHSSDASSSVVSAPSAAALPQQQVQHAQARAQPHQRKQSSPRQTSTKAPAQGHKGGKSKTEATATVPGESAKVQVVRNRGASLPSNKRKAEEANTEKGNAAASAKRAPPNVGQAEQAQKKQKPSPAVATVFTDGTGSSAKSAAPVRERDTPAAVSVVVKKGGMQFFVPKAPASLTLEHARMVQMGQVHSLLDTQQSGAPVSDSSDIMEYLLAVGAAVPIPKAFVSSALKDRMSIPGFKNNASSAGFNIPREIVVVVVLIWLWNYHEDDFQSAFAKSGRIDVDPTCKWLVQAAVDTSVRALMLYIKERNRKAGSAAKNPTESSVNAEVVAASVVGKALTSESCLSIEIDRVLPQFHELVQLLDECRLCALHSRSQERVLLANLISLKTVMSESFAHAYVSSMVRAGDALGHDTLAEIVADDDLKISSLLPYDIFKDETGLWEDPCRPDGGFTQNSTGDVLTKVAHARAMIQKSLRRLQDRHHIKMGTPNFGAYADFANGQSHALSSGPGGANSSGKSVSIAGGGTPRSTWSRKKVSSVLEGPVPSGTGSAQATSWALYVPKHVSAPLEWNMGHTENSPYGRNTAERRSSASLNPAGQHVSVNKLKTKNKKGPAGDSGAKKKTHIIRSTHEIDWKVVAGSFHRVKLPGGGGISSHSRAAPPTASAKNIVSPFCRKLEGSPVASDDESDGEEDLSDEAVLQRHLIVLENMKDKLSAFMEARKKQQERRKNRQKNSS